MIGFFQVSSFLRSNVSLLLWQGSILNEQPGLCPIYAAVHDPLDACVYARPSEPHGHAHGSR